MLERPARRKRVRPVELDRAVRARLGNQEDLTLVTEDERVGQVVRARERRLRLARHPAVGVDARVRDVAPTGSRVVVLEEDVGRVPLPEHKRVGGGRARQLERLEPVRCAEPDPLGFGFAERPRRDEPGLAFAERPRAPRQDAERGRGRPARDDPIRQPRKRLGLRGRARREVPLAEPADRLQPVRERGLRLPERLVTRPVE